MAEITIAVATGDKDAFVAEILEKISATGTKVGAKDLEKLALAAGQELVETFFYRKLEDIVTDTHIQYQLFNGEKEPGEWAEGFTKELANRVTDAIGPMFVDFDMLHQAVSIFVAPDGGENYIVSQSARHAASALIGNRTPKQFLAGAGVLWDELAATIGLANEPDSVGFFRDLAARVHGVFADVDTVSGLQQYLADLASDDESRYGMLHLVFDGVTDELRDLARSAFRHDVAPIDRIVKEVFELRHASQVNVSSETEAIREFLADKPLGKALSGFEGNGSQTDASGTGALNAADKPARRRRRSSSGGSDKLEGDTLAVALVRGHSGLNDGELADMIQVSRPTLAKYSKGSSSLTLDEDTRTKLLARVEADLSALQHAKDLLENKEG